MSRFFHVSSARNRDSIAQHGLDWTRMGASRGIAGSCEPELPGCFVALDEWETQWFVDMNNTAGPVDVWAVDGIEEADLVVSAEGLHYYPRRIAASQLSLVRADAQTAVQGGD